MAWIENSLVGLYDAHDVSILRHVLANKKITSDMRRDRSPREEANTIIRERVAVEVLNPKSSSVRNLDRSRDALPKR
jgi:hypothetical protein